MVNALSLLVSLAAAASSSIPKLQVQTVRYAFSGMPAVAIRIVNEDVVALDSLTVRVYVRSKDTLGTHTKQISSGLVSVPMTVSDGVAARYDICQKYDAAGFNKPCADAGWSWGTLNRAVQLLVPSAFGAADAQGVRDWAIDLPLGPTKIGPMEALRFDFLLVDRHDYSKLLTQAQVDLFDSLRQFLPDREALAVGDTGWWDVVSTGNHVPDLAASWSFAGIAALADQTAANSVIDGGNGPVNSRVLVRRKGVDLWGEAPDGSGPGTPVEVSSPDIGGVLPYAPIAAPLPIGGDRKPLDSALARPGRVRVNQAGYRLADVLAGRARVRYYGTAASFGLLREGASSPSRTGTFQTLGFQDGTRVTVCEQLVSTNVSLTPTCKIDSDTLKTSIPVGAVQEGLLPSDLAAGRWRVVVGSDSSSWFWVTDSVYGWVRDAAVRYFGVARSGDSSWFHGPSHMLDGSLDGATGAYKEGWYDAGDHLKEPQSMSMVLATLATLAAARPDLDADRWGAVHRADQSLDGVPDVLKEARWGATFFLNSWIRNGRTAGDTLGHPGMVTGIGEFGKDHGWWGPADLQDQVAAASRGGAAERTVRRELGANTLGDVAAGLALLSVKWRGRDATWADDALAAAKSMYEWAKAHRVVVASPAYSGMAPSKLDANLALASAALLWATRDSAYLKDLAYDKTLGNHGSTFQNLSSFEGGWMVMSNPNLWKGGANTDWANRHALALYAFAKLVLSDSATAASCGVRGDAERILLLRRTVAAMQHNLNAISASGPKAFDLPLLDPNGQADFVNAGANWGELFIQQDWAATAYMAGNAAELLMYADVARDLREGKGGAGLKTVAWPVDEVTSLALRQTDWLLGLNKWDVSFVAGIGARNLQDAHHRTANPDGSNTLVSYRYRTPVGGMWGFVGTDTTKANVAWNDYLHAEPTIAGQAELLSVVYLLSGGAGGSTSGVRTRALDKNWRMVAQAREHRVLARIEGLADGAMAEFELLDATGRKLATSERVTNSGNACQFLSRPVGRGVAIVRVRAAGETRFQAVVVP